MAARNAERDERIRTLRTEGQTLQAIAAAVGVSAERVRQVLLRTQGPTTIEVRSAVAARQRATAAELQERIREDLVAHPGSSHDELAARLGIDRATVHAHLPEDVRALVTRIGKPSERTWSSDEIMRAIAAAATYAYPLSAGDYDGLLVAGEVHGPSAARISQIYGNWSAACHRAGVEPTPPRRSNYQSKWTDADMLGFVRDYLRAPGSRGTFDGYDPWRRAAGLAAPSSASLRSRLGTWGDIKRKALEP